MTPQTEPRDWLGITLGCLWGLGSLLGTLLLGTLASEQQQHPSWTAAADTDATVQDMESGPT